MVGMVRRLFYQSGASFFRTAALAVAIIAIATSGARAESLADTGTVLTDVSVDPATADITRTINLNGDTPVATYVMAHTTGGKSLQRTNLGYWIPWSGNVDDLVDSKFEANAGSLTYKIIDQDISSFMFPITFVVAYSTGSALKFGVFQASPN
jgi:hypothetical protein